MLFSHKNRSVSFVEMWMNLETVILHELNQKEKTNIIYKHIYVES